MQHGGGRRGAGERAVLRERAAHRIALILDDLHRLAHPGVPPLFESRLERLPQDAPATATC
jgi:hypothetical protein